MPSRDPLLALFCIVSGVYLTLRDTDDETVRRARRWMREMVSKVFMGGRL